jgi:hypothetical protein
LEVSKFAKNFLPILFNLFSVESDNAKDPVLTNQMGLSK